MDTVYDCDSTSVDSDPVDRIACTAQEERDSHSASGTGGDEQLGLSGSVDCGDDR